MRIIHLEARINSDTYGKDKVYILMPSNKCDQGLNSVLVGSIDKTTWSDIEV